MATYLTPGVYVEEVDRGSKPIEGVGTAVAAFVGFTASAPPPEPGDPDGVKPRFVSNWTQYQKLFGGFAPNAMLPHSVYGYFNNGGGSCYIVRVPTSSGGSKAKAKAVGIDAAAKPGVDTLKVRALGTGDLEVEVVVDAPPAATPAGDDTAPPPPPSAQTFTINVNEGGRQVESFSELTFGKGSQNVETVVNARSTRVKVEVPTIKGLNQADRTPASGSYPVPGTPVTAVEVSGADFAGSEIDRTGIGGLAIADEVTMVAVPDLITAARKSDGSVDLDLYKMVQTSLIDFCTSRQIMAVLDAPPAMNPQQVKEWRSETAMYDSKYAAMYYPWLRVADPSRSNGSVVTIDVPPSGHVSGIWARNDATRGVWKAPANEVVRGIMDLEAAVTRGEQELLNPIGINVIRPFGTRGVRVWGARTLSSDPSWRYVNVRRLFNYIESSIDIGTQWVVFEPNDLDLWQRVKRTINSFLLGMWRQGALVGATPAEAFFVKCDAENNPPESVDEGKLIVEIGIAPVKPAEFVIFQISQWQGGAGADAAAE